MPRIAQGGLTLRTFLMSVVLLTAFGVSAAPAFLVSQFIENGDRICVYQKGISKHYVNVGIYICPLSIH